MTAAVDAKTGSSSFSRVAFSGSSTNIVLSDDSQVYIDLTTCTFVGSGTIVFFNSALGKAILKNTGATAPTTGTWQQGTIVEAVYPVSGSYIGSICTVTGTPGTWNSFGAIT